MAYEKIGFNKGDVLKAEHLNHIENELSLNNPNIRFSKMIFSFEIDLTDDEKRAMQENPASICFFNGDIPDAPTLFFSKERSGNSELVYYGINNASTYQLVFNLQGECLVDSCFYKPFLKAQNFEIIEGNRIQLEDRSSGAFYFLLVTPPEILQLRVENILLAQFFYS